MKVQTIDDDLLKIYKMKDIISIDFVDLYASKHDNKDLIVPGFLVFYGPSKQLFLTTHDKYFEEFVSRLKEVYQEEKDNVVFESILGPEYIKIDDTAKWMLCNGNIDVSSYYSHYKDRDGYRESLLFEEDKVDAIIPIFLYHLKETIKLFDINISNIRVSEGNNGVYYLKAIVHNTPVVLPLSFEEKDYNNYSFEIGNLLKDSVPIKIDIGFTNDGVFAHSVIDEYDYSDYFTYEYNINYPISTRETHLRGRLINYNKEHLPDGVITDNSFISFDGIEDTPKWVLLPWNSYLGYVDKINQFDQDKKMLERRMIYYSPNKDDCFIRDKYSKRYIKDSSTGIISENVTLDNMDKTTIMKKNDNGYLIEVCFHPEGVRGFYNTHLGGNYFYHISSANNHLDVSKKNTSFIDRNNGLEEKVDLLDVKKYYKK